jgi:hypothetical protein
VSLLFTGSKGFHSRRLKVLMIVSAMLMSFIPTLDNYVTRKSPIFRKDVLRKWAIRNNINLQGEL